MILLSVAAALAVPREDVLDNAAGFATHIWSMTSANESASCLSSYCLLYTSDAADDP